MKDIWKKIDKQVKQGLVIDKNLNAFLQPVFPNKNAREDFIKKCLKKTKTRRMLLRAQWYTEIADDMDKIRRGRPALRIIFLLAAAECVVKLSLGETNIPSDYAVKIFFSYISKEDKDKLIRNFKRTLLGVRHHKFRFSSIIRILYEIRNKAVHGEDYYSFSLLDEKEKKESSQYTHYGTITSGMLGKRGRKRRVSLDISLTYEELRDIIRRTAISNIQSLL